MSRQLDISALTWSPERLHAFFANVPQIFLDFSFKDHSKPDLLEKLFKLIDTHPIISLSCYVCKLGDSSMRAIAAGIQFSACLTTLDLRDNMSVSREGFLPLVQLLADNKLPSLHTLFLDKTKAPVNLLIKGILNSKTRTSLRIFSCTTLQGQSDEAIFALAALIKHTFLRELYFSIGNVGRESLVPLLQAIKFNKSLQVFRPYGGRVIPMDLLEDAFEENSTIVDTEGCIPPRFTTLNRVCRELKASNTIRKSVPKELAYESEVKPFVQELIKNSGVWHSMKIVVLGHGEIGKTTLLDTFKKIREERMKGQEWFFKKGANVFDKARTVGIDLSKMKVGSGEVIIYDFAGQIEYTVTHQFLLSTELVLYVLCFDLGAPLDKQMEQIVYWLDFLNSSLPGPSSSKWVVMVVGLRKDKCTNFSLDESVIPSWRQQWRRLPLHNSLFRVSSFTSEGVNELLLAIEKECERIFQQHTALIPTSFKNLLHSLQSIDDASFVVPFRQLFATHGNGMPHATFALALKYLHAIGYIVLLRNNWVCVNPSLIPKLAAKFISPKEVRCKLVGIENVELLDDDKIGVILGQNTEKLRAEITILQHLKVCYQLATLKIEKPTFLFPSLTSFSNTITFSQQREEGCQYSGSRFSLASTQLIFVPGFFCQLVVSILAKLNISRRDIVCIHSNGIVVRCQGLFVGELLVKIDPDSKSILLLLVATNPDLYFAETVGEYGVTTLTTNTDHLYKKVVLCPTCIESSFPKRDTFSNEITQPAKVVIGVLEDSDEKDVQFCNTKHHKFVKAKLVNEESLVCWTHQKKQHHFYLNYHGVEGRRSRFYSSEGEHGFIEILYERLATMKRSNGDSVFVFWDKKCLPGVLDWKKLYLHGLTNCSVIVLVISFKVIEWIAANADKRLDSLLFEYPTTQLFANLFDPPVNMNALFL